MVQTHLLVLTSKGPTALRSRGAGVAAARLASVPSSQLCTTTSLHPNRKCSHSQPQGLFLQAPWVAAWAEEGEEGVVGVGWGWVGLQAVLSAECRTIPSGNRGTASPFLRVGMQDA